MEKTKVFLCDDSLPVRRILESILSGEPDMEVVGTAANGKEAIAGVAEHKPDVIILDVEMPIMNGIDALKVLRKNDRLVPIIMFSASTLRGAELTFQALGLGASDYIAKPSKMPSLAEARVYLGQEMLPRIRAFASRYKALRRNRLPRRPSLAHPTAKPRSPVKGPGVRNLAQGRPGLPGRGAAIARRAPLPSKSLPNKSNSPGLSRPVPPQKRVVRKAIRLVTIGISTGGPTALAELLPKLPKDLPVPILIVQHMPPVFTGLLAERLNSQCGVTVKEGCDGAEVRPGEVWIAPGDYHMEVIQKRGVISLCLNQQEKEHSCRPAVDVLFRSVARSFGHSALAVVMTGMGSDGALGAVAIKRAGGHVWIQDKKSCVVWGMPGSTSKLGAHDAVYSLEELAPAITKEVYSRRAIGSSMRGRQGRVA